MSAVDCHRNRGSGCSRLGYGIYPLGGGAINPTIELPELTQDWERDSWRAQTEFCAHQDPGERNSDPKKSEPDLPVSVQESPHELVVACCRVGALSVAVPARDLLKEVTIIFNTFTVVWPQVPPEKSICRSVINS